MVNRSSSVRLNRLAQKETIAHILSQPCITLYTVMGMLKDFRIASRLRIGFLLRLKAICLNSLGGPLLFQLVQRSRDDA